MKMSQTTIFIIYTFLLCVCLVNGQFMFHRDEEKAKKDAIRPVIEKQFPGITRECLEKGVKWCVDDPSGNDVVNCAKEYFEGVGWSCILVDDPSTTNNPESTKKFDPTTTASKSDSDGYDC